MKQELGRILRHGLPVLVTYAIAKGWISPTLQQPLLELGGAVITFAVAYFASVSVSKGRGRK